MLPLIQNRRYFSVWRRISGFLYDSGCSGMFKKQVGTDFSGNKYYVFKDKADGPEKRKVIYKNDIADPENLPIETWAWLSFRRQDFPSLIELQENQKQQELFQEKIAAIDKRDAINRQIEIEKGNHTVIDQPLGSDYDDTLRFFDNQQMYQESAKARQQQDQQKQRKKNEKDQQI